MYNINHKNMRNFIKLFLLITVCFFSQNYYCQSNVVFNTTSTTPGQLNVIIGKDAGLNAITTNPPSSLFAHNSLFGYSSGLNLGSPTLWTAHNTLFGSQSGVNSLGGESNTYIGASSGYNSHVNFAPNVSIYGRYNTSLGMSSGYNNNGNSNTFIGSHNGSANNTGSLNTFLGFQTGRNNTSGNSNIFIGGNAGVNNVSGSENISVGSIGPLNGTRNISIGQRAGEICSGINNIMIGNKSGEFFKTGSNNLFLGYVRVPENQLSDSNYSGTDTYNTIILADNAGNTRFYLDNNGRAGINLGTYVRPQNTLEIKHGVNGNSGLRFTNLNNANTAVASNGKVLSVNSTGDVILVNDNVGSGSGGSTTITAGTNIAVAGTSSTGYTISSPYQSLSLVDNNLSISGSNTVTLPSFTEVDGSVTNELQTLSQTGNTISLSNGGGSFNLPTFTDTDAQTLSLNSNIFNHTNDISISNGNTIQVPMTYISPGSNTNITGNGSQLNPYIISSTSGSSGTDLSIYNDNGIINQSTTTGLNRIVDLNDRNIWFNSATSNNNGRIYIGNTAVYPTINSNYRLYVEGGILTERVRIALRATGNWADYVFKDDYKLMPLNEVEDFIDKNNHLPGIESADQLLKSGLDLSEMQAKQMAKIEELTLYIIEQNKNLKKQSEEIEEMKNQLKQLLNKK